MKWPSLFLFYTLTAFVGLPFLSWKSFHGDSTASSFCMALRLPLVSPIPALEHRLYKRAGTTTPTTPTTPTPSSAAKKTTPVTTKATPSSAGGTKPKSPTTATTSRNGVVQTSLGPLQRSFIDSSVNDPAYFAFVPSLATGVPIFSIFLVVFLFNVSASLASKSQRSMKA